MSRWRTVRVRRGRSATYGVQTPCGFFGLTLFRRGAVSLLAPIGRDGVPLQVVFGDWWMAT